MNKPYSLFKLRKRTTPIHWLVGGVDTAIFVKCWPAAVAWILIFALLERWDDLDHGTLQGDMDWWDAVIVAFIGISVVVILGFIGVISIKWWP